MSVFPEELREAWLALRLRKSLIPTPRGWVVESWPDSGSSNAVKRELLTVEEKFFLLQLNTLDVSLAMMPSREI
jgi:hypothetical protein